MKSLKRELYTLRRCSGERMGEICLLLWAILLWNLCLSLANISQGDLSQIIITKQENYHNKNTQCKKQAPISNRLSISIKMRFEMSIRDKLEITIRKCLKVK